jgi:transcriptional regulator with XRE-family HTH domain
MHKDIILKYGQAIRILRQNKSISQEQLADLCGLHRTYISDVELGKRNVSLENIDKIASALDMNVSEIFIEVEKI